MVKRRSAEEAEDSHFEGVVEVEPRFEEEEEVRHLGEDEAVPLRLEEEEEVAARCLEGEVAAVRPGEVVFLGVVAVCLVEWLVAVEEVHLAEEEFLAMVVDFEQGPVCPEEREYLWAE